MSLRGNRWERFVKNKEASGVCRLDCVPVQLSLHMETAGYVCLNRWYTHESVKAEAKRKLIYLLLQLCQQRDGVAEEFSLQRSSAPGHFYRLLLPLYPHRREVSWRGFF